MNITKYNKIPTVGVLVVTYNRIKYLKKLIKSLSKINYPMSELLIFDNNSDYPIKHLDFIKEYCFEGNPKITINRSKTNLGGSGGFHYGIKELYKKYDFVWTMDDDVSFNPSALSELIQISKNNVVSVPVKINKNDNIIDVTATNLDLKRYFFLQHKYGLIKDIIAKSNKILVETFSFEGVLFPSLIIKNIGLPVNNYFIAHDDLEYSCRLKKHNFQIILSYNARCKREFEINRTANFFSWKSYYSIRNYFWVHRDYLNSKLWFTRPAFFSSIFLFFNLITFNIDSFKNICKGIIDGIRS